MILLVVTFAWMSAAISLLTVPDFLGFRRARLQLGVAQPGQANIDAWWILCPLLCVGHHAAADLHGRRLWDALILERCRHDNAFDFIAPEPLLEVHPPLHVSFGGKDVVHGIDLPSRLAKTCPAGESTVKQSRP
jgi:hypothetical protein